MAGGPPGPSYNTEQTMVEWITDKEDCGGFIQRSGGRDLKDFDGGVGFPK
jgi:hypothetical protein